MAVPCRNLISLFEQPCAEMSRFKIENDMSQKLDKSEKWDV
jgi:hypothetical protein